MHSPEVLSIDNRGVWRSDGEEISHEPTLRLFCRSVVRRPDGFYLEIGREKKKLVVEDTAFFITGVEGDPSSGFELRVSDGRTLTLDPTHLSYSPERLVVALPPDSVSGEALEARFAPAAYWQLLKFIEEDPSGNPGYFLRIGEKVTRL